MKDPQSLQDQKRAAPARRAGRRQVWLFRCLAIVLGLAPFLAAEIVLRLAAFESETAWSAPEIEFDAIRPLFVLDGATNRYVIPETRQPFFKPDSFPANKAPDEFRIFCFGGSTVQGNPYSTPTAFTKWLELSLKAAAPTRDWRVINCGGISYASYRLAPIFYECLGYEPDLMILYLGDNEFLEERSYVAPIVDSQWLMSLAELRLVQFGRSLYQGLIRDGRENTASGRIRLAAEVDALLDYRGGLEKYHRDDAWRRRVVEHFRATLREMIEAARQSNVSVYLVDPVANVKDCAPFKVEVSKSLSEPERGRLQELLERSRAANVPLAERIETLEEALRIDPRHAGAWYALGRAYLDNREFEKARDALFRAKDEDVCPLRIIEPLRDVIYDVGRHMYVPIVPVMDHFELKSPHGIPGDELLLDHVHPSISGQQMIADLILQTMERRGLIDPVQGWEEKRTELYAEHMATLDTPYFARGQEHLEGLRKWAQGRVTKVRPGVDGK